MASLDPNGLNTIWFHHGMINYFHNTYASHQTLAQLQIFTVIILCVITLDHKTMYSCLTIFYSIALYCFLGHQIWLLFWFQKWSTLITFASLLKTKLSVICNPSDSIVSIIQSWTNGLFWHLADGLSPVWFKVITWAILTYLWIWPLETTWRSNNRNSPSRKCVFLSMCIVIWLIILQAWISNYIHYEIYDEIAYLFPNFNAATVEVWEWISNFIPHYWVCDYMLTMLRLIRLYPVGIFITKLKSSQGQEYEGTRHHITFLSTRLK